MGSGGKEPRHVGPRSDVYDFARVPETFSYWGTAIYAERGVTELKERLVTEYSGYAVVSALVAGLSFSAYINPPLHEGALAADEDATPQQRAALRAYSFAYALSILFALFDIMFVSFFIGWVHHLPTPEVVAAWLTRTWAWQHMVVAWCLPLSMAAYAAGVLVGGWFVYPQEDVVILGALYAAAMLALGALIGRNGQHADRLTREEYQRQRWEAEAGNVAERQGHGGD